MNKHRYYFFVLLQACLMQLCASGADATSNTGMNWINRLKEKNRGGLCDNGKSNSASLISEMFSQEYNNNAPVIPLHEVTAKDVLGRIFQSEKVSGQPGKRTVLGHIWTPELCRLIKEGKVVPPVTEGQLAAVEAGLKMQERNAKACQTLGFDLQLHNSSKFLEKEKPLIVPHLTIEMRSLGVPAEDEAIKIGTAEQKEALRKYIAKNRTFPQRIGVGLHTVFCRTPRRVMSAGLQRVQAGTGFIGSKIAQSPVGRAVGWVGSGFVRAGSWLSPRGWWSWIRGNRGLKQGAAPSVQLPISASDTVRLSNASATASSQSGEVSTSASLLSELDKR